MTILASSGNFILLTHQDTFLTPGESSTLLDFTAEHALDYNHKDSIYIGGTTKLWVPDIL